MSDAKPYEVSYSGEMVEQVAKTNHAAGYWLGLNRGYLAGTVVTFVIYMIFEFLSRVI